MNRIPDSYQRCSLRNITPVCPQSQIVGIGFDTPTGVFRLSLSVADAKTLTVVLAGYINDLAGSQSPMSELMPNVLVSTPSLGEKV